jgi:hypothetical protein
MEPSKLARPAAFILLVGVLGLVSLTIVYGRQLNYPPIRSEGMG